MRSHGIPVPGFVLALMAIAFPAAAQRPQPAAGGVIVVPRAGWVFAVGALGRVSEGGAFSTEPARPSAMRRISLRSGPTIGTAALFDVPDLPILWRIDFDHAPSLGLHMRGAERDMSATATFATAGVVTRAHAGRFEPYAQAGVGFRALTFQASEPGGPSLPDGRVDLLGRFGGGLAIRFGAIAVTAEAVALTSSFRFSDADGNVGDRTFHLDLATLLGMRIPVY